MFNSSNIEQKVLVNNEIAYRDKYANLLLRIENVEIIRIKNVNETDNKWCWLHDTHKEIIINKGEMDCVIHNSISGIIKAGFLYRIWFASTDKNHNRYKEIVLAEMVNKL
jgi:hypothetical protein